MARWSGDKSRLPRVTHCTHRGYLGRRGFDLGAASQPWTSSALGPDWILSDQPSRVIILSYFDALSGEVGNTVIKLWDSVNSLAAEKGLWQASLRDRPVRLS
ncbi:predicted protein [Uncinocarpus reesii 1704]|uniref:Uncharacterized protein n=1 Tax=Uncinocarpus reesii (strain UAMH 1704) TaxID=336963 RepID=C4JK30_UNCRE|nr:uncharacterized protein UREG_01987 [Uncinocarpus reesii 1704]EEP77138.1 predicted protein [Uncinocarpus reesii 1704]